MYSRDYEGKELNFEASGGLVESALVMRDKETDTYWSLMKGKALTGPMAGTDLKELPNGIKVQWKEWVERHPETRVLSVEGREDLPRTPYDEYFASEEGFRGDQAEDNRLATKTPIYGFRLEGESYAVPLAEIEGGGTFRVNGQTLFFFRPEGSAIFRSSAAFRASAGSFQRVDGLWQHDLSGAIFRPESNRFEGDASHQIERLRGFDTFWYTWSPMHPGTQVLSD